MNGLFAGQLVSASTAFGRSQHRCIVSAEGSKKVQAQAGSRVSSIGVVSRGPYARGDRKTSITFSLEMHRVDSALYRTGSFSKLSIIGFSAFSSSLIA